MFYSICYDISDDHRRLKIARLLEDFGERVQYSVFEANLDKEQLGRLKRGAVSILDAEQDSLRIYPLCAGCMRRIEVFGQGKITEDPEFIII